MTYWSVLIRFIGPPLGMLVAVTAYDRLRGRTIASPFRTWPAWAVLLGHIAIALLYTTPWDNYLVATGVWWYDPSLVAGLTVGWVPIEEYTFFVVQTLAVGLWLLAWLRRVHSPREPFRSRPLLRWISTALSGAAWVLWLLLLRIGWNPGRYMALLLVWFLPPIILQLAFGADILWHHRAIVGIGILAPFAYLCLVDAIAIGSGTWTISPAHTVGLELGDVLPLEEIVFFLLTNVLIVFGVILMLAGESHIRAGTPAGRALVGKTA